MSYSLFQLPSNLTVKCLTEGYLSYTNRLPAIVLVNGFN